MVVLGLETSCDETSIAILDKGIVRANAVYTQSIHSRYGGVVPEMASRAHLQKIDRLCRVVFDEQAIGLDKIDLIAVTDRPGLAGALLVGISFAMGLSCAGAKPVIGVNHLEGHIASVTLQHPELAFPFLALVVSGGHTALYTVTDFGAYTLLGKTIDDAAGEAFDKIGKMLGFTYPAGRQIEQMAATYTGGNPILFPIARVEREGINFSFSGLKTAVKYYLAKQTPQFIEENKGHLCYSVQKAIIDALVRNVEAAVKLTAINRIAVVGGVACNGALRAALQSVWSSSVFFPSLVLCTDNAAMIAKAGYENYTRGIHRFPSMTPEIEENQNRSGLLKHKSGLQTDSVTAATPP
ncbi:MAG: tRNA (adenosine(37)-N6)-threonylcarbamoyltransferase complex transferase subunit TsaD [Chitinivibrionales bacterium]|nr:tRNA (adenosine(37)-N6)-threonylcarbamoyltransferase complex transferase subunit TsaD [Chitinivibrionales bacterium]